MSAHLGKIALMMAMSHGFRTLGRISGPRWAALALGLPCSTAVALVGGGSDRGVDYAVMMSGTSLLGLVGAVVLPMAYALSVLQGWGMHRALLLGVASYLLVALTVSRLLPDRGEASLVVALLAVVGTNIMAGRLRGLDEVETVRRRTLSITWTRILRTAVPIACLSTSMALGEIFGPEMAGLMSTFPGLTLTVLALTHLESGPISAIKMARALPSGNLAMVGFLAAFRFGCPSLGLAWGTGLGYLASLAVLMIVIGSESLRAWINERPERIRETREPSRPAWPRAGRRFSPGLETFAW